MARLEDLHPFWKDAGDPSPWFITGGPWHGGPVVIKGWMFFSPQTDGGFIGLWATSGWVDDQMVGFMIYDGL